MSAELMNRALLSNLKDTLKVSGEKVAFTCGGTIPIVLKPNTGVDGSLAPRTQAKRHSQQVLLKPVTVRFGPPNAGQVLRLPTDEIYDSAFQLLIGACTPATFGRGGQDVYDEAYRKATKLDPSEFLTDFCPHEAGIMDIVTQILLPACKGFEDMRGLKAELYKMNVYSGPGGKFKPHVDTPRGTRHIGSLVVALPSQFQGGQLAVRKHGHSTMYDWSASALHAIQWAAFYSDCEHEVLPLQSGHRITLTYNLYVARGTGLLTGKDLTLDVTNTPLFQVFSNVLSVPGFMGTGGKLGIYLAHRYPYTDKKLGDDMPAALKGIDMMVYEVVRALGLEFKLDAVVEDNTSDLKDYEEYHCPDCYRLEARQVIEGIYTGMSNLAILDNGHEYSRAETLREAYNSDFLRAGDVTWISPWLGKKELQMVHLAYGNQASLGTEYSRAAFFITIPPYAQRGGSRAAPVDLTME